MAKRVVREDDADTVVVERERGVDRAPSSSGPVLAIVLLILLILALLWWRPWGSGGNDTTDIEVNTPTPTTNQQ